MGEQTIQFNAFSPKLGQALKDGSPHVKDFVRIKEAVDKVVIKNPDNGVLTDPVKSLKSE